MKYQNPKGTIDYFPEQKEVMNKIFGNFKTVAESYGCKEIETPAFETFELLSAKTGPEIKEQLFMLEKRSGEEFALRPEYTSSVARMFIEKQKEIVKPVRWFYMGKLWRYEQPQKARLREFYQMGVELFGSDKVVSDSEVISIVIDFFKSLGLKKSDFKIKLNNRKLLQGILSGMINEKNEKKKEKILEEAMRVVDKKRKLPESQFKAECESLGIDKIIDILDIKDLDELEELKLNEVATKGLEDLRQILNLVDNDFVELDLSVARGLGYYTGTVFEAYDKNEKLRALCGGGRYDNMIESFGGESCPATGFAIGLTPLTIFLEEMEKIPKPEKGPDYFVAPVNDAMLANALEIANRLRENFKVEVEVMGRKLGKQLDYASSINAGKVVIVGEKDLSEKKVTVRDMESGKEEKVDLKKLL
jgi:histidyl-tRNA synthetase